jgi:hypothetical protein
MIRLDARLTALPTDSNNNSCVSSKGTRRIAWRGFRKLSKTLDSSKAVKIMAKYVGEFSYNCAVARCPEILLIQQGTIRLSNHHPSKITTCHPFSRVARTTQSTLPQNVLTQSLLLPVSRRRRMGPLCVPYSSGPTFSRRRGSNVSMAGIPKARSPKM